MKHSTTRDNLFVKIIFVVISAVFWTALWDFISYKVSLEVLLPSPAQTFSRLFELSKTKEFWFSALQSIKNTLTGFINGVIAGTLFAIPTAFLRSVNSLFSPINTVIRATPVASFIILAYVWIDDASIPSFIAFLMVTPIVWNTLKTAIQKVDPQLKEMSQAYGLSFFKKSFYLYIPSVMPQYITSLLTSMGLSWKAGIAAEVLIRPKGTIGTEIYNSKTYLETTDLFAYTATVIILSIIIEMIFRTVMKKLMKEGK